MESTTTSFRRPIPMLWAERPTYDSLMMMPPFYPQVETPTSSDLDHNDDCVWPLALRPIDPHHSQKAQHLPPIQDVMPPLPSPPYCSSSPSSSICGSPFTQHSESRKSSIASLLNDMDEVRKAVPTLCDRTTASPQKRGRPSTNTSGVQKKRRRQMSHDKNGRTSKGLRHFSKLVADKVEQHGLTTYNEVAEQLALHVRDGNVLGTDSNADQKNIRRRVYDALNVLMAMGIIVKNSKKQIQWVGFEISPIQDQIKVEEQRHAELTSSVDRLRQIANGKLERLLQIHALISRNQSQNMHAKPEERVEMPFFVAGCHSTFHVQTSHDAREAVIESADVDVYDDAQVLRTLGFRDYTAAQATSWLRDPSWHQELVA